MTTRILIGTLAIGVILAIVFADAALADRAPSIAAVISRGSFIPLTLALLSGLGAIELGHLFRRAGHAPYIRWAVVCVIALVLSPWLAPAGLLGPEMLNPMRSLAMIVAVAVLGAGIVGVVRSDVQDGLGNLASTVWIICYLGLLPAFLTVLRCDLPGAGGAWIVAAIVLICKASDIGAYFVGSAIGRTRFITQVSPKKTLEGCLGGLVVSSLLSLYFWHLHHQGRPVGAEAGATFADPDTFLHAATVLFHGLTWTQALIFGGVIAIAGQVGDLVESVLKRSAGAKDSAALLPGFGGILDMIDSPVAVAPLAWFMLTTLWPVL